MTTKIICNKCGEEIKEESLNHVKITISKRASPGNENVPGTKFHKKTIDLCYKCSKEFDKFFTNSSEVPKFW